MHAYHCYISYHLMLYPRCDWACSWSSGADARHRLLSCRLYLSTFCALLFGGCVERPVYICVFCSEVVFIFFIAAQEVELMEALEDGLCGSCRLAERRPHCRRQTFESILSYRGKDVPHNYTKDRPKQVHY